MSLPRNHISRSAFSLIELLTVVAILAILAVVTVPALPSLMGAKGVSKAVTDVSYLFELARREAIARSSFVFVGFENGTNAGVAELRVAAASSPDGSSTNALISISRVVRLPNVRLAPYNELPASVRSAASNAAYFIDTLSATGVRFTNGNQVFSNNILVVSPEGELLSSPGAGAFLPSASMGFVQMRGATPSSTDGAVVTIDGGSGSITIVRP